MKPKYGSRISDENSLSELRCAARNTHQISETWHEKNVKYLISTFLYRFHVEMVIFWISWVKGNILELVSSVSFSLFNVAHILFLLDSTAPHLSAPARGGWA